MSAPSPTCCLGGHDGTLQEAAVSIKCFYPYVMLLPHVPSAAICWGAGKGSAGGVQTPWPSLTWPGGQHCECHCCCTPVLIIPQGPDTLSSSHMALEGSKMGPEGRLAAPATMKSPCLCPRARLVAMAKWRLSQQPWGLPLQVPPMGTAGFPTGTGGKGIYFNKPKQTKPLKLFFSFPLFLTGKDSHVLPAGWL